MTYEYTLTHQSNRHFMVETIFIMENTNKYPTVCLRVLPRLCLSINHCLIHIQIWWCMDADTIIKY